MKIISGSFLGNLILTIITLLAGITTGEPILLIVGFINVFLLIYQYDKHKKKIEEEAKKKKEIERKNKKINRIKEMAKRNIEEKYIGIKLSEEQKKDLIREEFIRLMMERK